MSIKLNKYYTITSDNLNIFLNYQNERQVIDKDGKEKTVVSKKTTYHNSIEQALRSFADKEFNDIEGGGEHTAKDLADLIKESTERIIKEFKSTTTNNK